jgi:hypothetical protein
MIRKSAKRFSDQDHAQTKAKRDDRVIALWKQQAARARDAPRDTRFGEH